MRTQSIYFSKQKPICVFPRERSDLAKASSELKLEGSYPVIVLIGGDINEQEADVTRQAIETIARIA